MQMRDVAQRIGAAIPKIEQDVSDSSSNIRTMFESLKDAFKPYIDRIAQTIDTVTNMQAQITAVYGRVGLLLVWPYFQQIKLLDCRGHNQR